jgi:hypothetical protein
MDMAYNLDRESPLVTGTAEEILSSVYWKQYPASWANFSERQRATLVKCMEMYASAQSTTIERLTKALEDIAEEDTRSFAGFTKEQLIDIAREALNSIKK